MACLKDNFIKDQLLDGRFRTVAPLNHGSFGIVFLATDIETNEDVAIKRLAKVPSEELSSSVDERFEELACHRRLPRNSHLVNLIHTFETEDHIYLVLEYCANGDLYEAIRLGHGPLETEHVRDFMLQLVSAIEFMHANSVYHRDIKPENIFLTQDGSMKLGDYGLATSSSVCHESCVGSDRYMAPEQYEPTAAGYSPAKADIWAVGICLLNVLFARNPFVTPTESDILFGDYVRDRQSLFDIFPSMSQDTFEILKFALAIDPNKRSLASVRDAILRAVSFTTDDELFDEFCIDEREVVSATANREPLRTPSIQSPQINQGDSFPWAKALRSSPPQDVRQLSVIPDVESYSEDLFSSSETAGTSWFSANPQTPSMASVLESVFSESYAVNGPSKRHLKYSQLSDPVPIARSMPTNALERLPSLSRIFEQKGDDRISKSWSDLWEEDESENEDLVLQQRHEKNSRSWSQESRNASYQALNRPDSNSTPISDSGIQVAIPVAEPASCCSVMRNSTQEHLTSCNSLPGLHELSLKERSFDKWSALGDKRRNYKHRRADIEENEGSNARSCRSLGSSGFDYGSWFKARPQVSREIPNDNRRRPLLESDWRRDILEGRKAQIGRPSNDYDGSIDEDLDLVGGWHDLHF